MSFAKKWWGKNFIESLENFADVSRLSRGRSYARNGKILTFDHEKNIIKAQVEGSINPYFHQYKLPIYKITIEIDPIPEERWQSIIRALGEQAYHLSHLLLNQMAEDIEQVFLDQGLTLSPSSEDDFLKLSCSCPDYAVPCKHIAGVFYLMAQKLDDDPILLFELRGLKREILFKELKKTELGRLFSEKMTQTNQQKLRTTESFYPVVESLDDKPISNAHFFFGHTLPDPPIRGEKCIPAVLVKKQGDFPGFWEPHTSFISWMETVYARVNRAFK